ncbi:Folylpolyglutamate synthase [Paraliobacillus sp. PM-2]|uniref:bifunctional folylpolyglutamate synthase/dihydrofolate synthase n=1 Tax=Paraliobacillus sp. PM-2 TaxID=1462524 RepID=UPI00061BBC4D|nr:Mur ligase family protein [Paraliobacillus sp. PM-2]CQR48022.1 Folylpolyglutamate synthase [Paraliobacillus sp. PM-2]
MLQTIEELNQFLDIRESIGIKPGLHRMKYLLEACNHPEERLQAIHIAGTNGKGSTATFLSGILQASDHVVGTFTSPSLTNRQGMIQINGVAISNQNFLRYFNNLYIALTTLDEQDDPASNFEIMVTIAFQYFADHTTYTIIEAGMGGLEDATNCFNPILSIITSIDYDHTYYLGSHLESIATHKAGIIKKNCPVIIGQLPNGAKKVIEKKASEQATAIYRYGIDFCAEQQDTRSLYNDEDLVFPFQLNMVGDHQRHNAAIAIKSARLLMNQEKSITFKAIQTGLLKAVIPARFEIIYQNPMIIIDGAHNVASINAFRSTVVKEYPDYKKHLLFAAFKDKPLEQMIRQVDSTFDAITFTTFNHQRAETAEALIALSNHKNKAITNNWCQFLQEKIQSNHDKEIIFVVGSLAFVTHVRKAIQ